MSSSSPCTTAVEDILKYGEAQKNVVSIRMYFVDPHEIKKGFSEWKQDTDVGDDLSTTLPANASFRSARKSKFREGCSIGLQLRMV